MASKFLDFQQIKATVKIETLIAPLDLTMKQNGEQLRGACPACGGNDRSLVITPAKGMYYCFSAKKGGDVIALVSHVREIGARDAAEEIVSRYCTVQSTGTSTGTVRHGTVPADTEPQSGSGEEHPGNRTLQPLSYLQSEHELVQALGVSPETCEFFGAGFAGKGILRGRLAIPIHDLNGELVGYCGRAVKDDQTPLLLFHKEFQPALYVFNLHRADGQITTTNDPLDVLMEYECTGETTMASFLHRGAKIIPLRKRA
jgi:DNA primase